MPRDIVTIRRRGGLIVPATVIAGGASPVSLPSEFWWDASDASTFSLSGSNVTQWRDKCGRGRHLTKGGGGALDSVLVAGVQNALPGVRCDMSGNDNSVLTTTSPFTLAQPFCIHMALKCYSGAAPEFSFLCGNAAGTLGLFITHSSYGGAAVYAGTGFGMGGGIASSTPAYFSARFNGTTLSRGSISTKSPLTGQSAGINFINNENFQLGFTGALVGFGGHILEIFGYSDPGANDTVFTDSINYLASKWGLT